MTHAPRLHRATEPPTKRSWFVAHAAGLITLALGVTSFVVVSLTARQFWATPDWRITVPFLIATVGVAVVSLVRRERAIVLPLLGVGFAAASVVLGWFLLTAIVVGVTTIIILGLSHAM